MYAWFNTNVTFQENLTPGGPIGAGVTLEDGNLVAKSAPGFVARGYWNFLGRFSVDFGYTGFRRNKTTGFLFDVPFGDSTYTAGASVTTSTRSDLPYLDFRYDFIKNEHTQFGLSLGASYVMLKAELSASAGVIGPNGPVIGQTVTRIAEEKVPVPLLGVKFDQQVGEGLSAGVIFNGLFAPVHPYVGSVFDAEAHLDWFATKNFGVSARVRLHAVQPEEGTDQHVHPVPVQLLRSEALRDPELLERPGGTGPGCSAARPRPGRRESHGAARVRPGPRVHLTPTF